ncbi:MAG: sulfite exporter TauE/SafE family protein [Balneolaceae bacterium]
MELAILFIIGTFAGVLAGLFGIGGGLLFTPVFYILFTLQGVADPVSWTIGTSLFCTFTASLGSSFQQFRQSSFYLREGFFVGIFGSAGVYGGKSVVTAHWFSEEIFVTLFVLLLLLVSLLYWMRSRPYAAEARSRADENPLGNTGPGLSGAFVTGGAGGFVAALAGVGGGVVMVPIMNLWIGIRLARAVSISSAAIVLISLSGWLQFALLVQPAAGVSGLVLGAVNFGAALPVVAGAFLGGMGGVLLGRIANPRLLRAGFALFAVVVAVVMITRLLQ